MSIISVSIRNFRSISTLDEKTLGLNIFVGQNDEGKSNILRALDLFFNHAKADGYNLNWEQDYCRFTPKRKGKAEEISITLEIVPPLSFSNRAAVLWKKTWRREGLHSDEVRHSDKKPISSTNKVTAFLKAMRFDYVPAIKGKDYFQALMAKLHDMLEATVEGKVRAASSSFTEAINANTQGILDQILKRLSLQSTIQLPSDLRDLFAQLEFTSISTKEAFSLQQRGDGVKVRHIPIVLRWLAEQANHLSSPGKPKSVTIWGYEEPENNLELRRCFELAKEFVEDSTEIQSFVTTHSPAFYSVFRSSDAEQVKLFLVTKSQDTGMSHTKPLVDGDLLSLDSSMGLLALLEPHFKEARQELEKLRTSVRNLHDTTKATIFCEGPSDKKVFEEALRLFFSNEEPKIQVCCSTHHGGGHTWVGDMLVAWSFGRPTAKAVGLFDQDAEALRTMKEITQKINNPPSGKMAYTLSLIPSSELRNCFGRKFKVPFAIEECYPENIWNYAEVQGWLEDRANPIGIYKFDKIDKTFQAHILELLPESHLRRLALKKVSAVHKEALAKYVCELAPQAARELALIALKPTLEKCLQQLALI